MSKTETRKRQPSKSEQARRKRQSAGERTVARRQAKRRQRSRDNWADSARALLGDIDTARVMFADDPGLSDRLRCEFFSLPEKQRGQDSNVEYPDSVEAMDYSGSNDRTRRVRFASAALSSAVNTDGDGTTDDDEAEHPLPGIVSLASEAKKTQRRDDIDKAPVTGWADMAGQAGMMLAANAAVLGWSQTGWSSGSRLLVTVGQARAWCPHGSAERMGERLRAVYDAYSGPHGEAPKPPGFQHDPMVKIPDYHNRLFTVIDAAPSVGSWETDWLFGSDTENSV